jgi:hypothetical protein
MPKKFVSPRQQCICPMCGEAFYPGDCAIVAANGDILKPQTANIFSRMRVTPIQGRSFVRLQATRRCPHCDSSLPDNIESARSYTIAIVGDITSGKSLYIASCIYQLLQDHALQMIGCTSVTGQADTDERFYDEYYKPMYLDRQKLAATQPIGLSGKPYQPLIYELGFPGRPPVNLLFYDASGEDISVTPNMEQYSHFIFNAGAIIFLADPMQMPGIVDTLPNNLKPGPDLQRKLTSAQVLERVIRSFKKSGEIGQDAMVKTPIAITVSKSDLLKYAAARGNKAAVYLYDNTYSNRLNIPNFRIISDQVVDLLNDFGDSRLLRSSRRFENACFFAVSATGWSPDADGNFPPLEPKRCLDPLLWALWKLNVIDIERF